MIKGPGNLIGVFCYLQEVAGELSWSRGGNRVLALNHASQGAHLGAWEDRCRAGVGRPCVRGEGDGP